MAEQTEHPRYRELRSRPGRPDGSAWGLWGEDDEVGALNLLTPEAVVAAARLVRRGAVFPLNWGLENPQPALFRRGPLDHVKKDDGFGMDDHFNRFFPHGSTHWDSLGHFSHPEHGYYGGRTSEELKGPDAKNSIAGWARRGVAGRFLLADVERWRHEVGRPIAQGTSEAVPIDDVAATLAAQGVQPQVGDILLVRLGWIEWYGGLDSEGREGLAAGWEFVSPGLSPAGATVEWLWDSGVVAVASDVPALEAFPFPVRGRSLHGTLLPLLGINLGEMFALDALAADCAVDGTYVGLLTSAPMNFVGATGSPANALALK
jgi:kynurenine formamidase